MVLFKLCCKNKINGIAIKPEKETALPISITSFIIKLDGFKKNWKKINEIREVKITKIMLIIKSLNVRLCILYILKNSTGTNKTNKATQNKIKNQNKPCAFQVVTDFSTIPTDSSKR